MNQKDMENLKVFLFEKFRTNVENEASFQIHNFVVLDSETLIFRSIIIYILIGLKMDTVLTLIIQLGCS